MKKVAIVGVEGSGKTVMLAGLGERYSHPDEDGYFLSPKNYATASYVAEKIERMRKGAWPVATAEDVMQGLDWTLKRRQGERQRPEDVCEVSCLDFAGEVYRLAFGIRQGAIPDDLADEVSELKQYIRNADDLIVLINLRDVITNGLRDTRVQEAMWITNEILSYALDEKGGRKVPRAAIVLSQADSYAETIKACRGPQGVLEKYLPHVANDYSWLDILAVSAVDKTILDDNGNEVPSPDFQSEELRAIMGWIRVGFEGVEAASTVGPAPLSPPQQPSPSAAQRPSRIGKHFSLEGRQSRAGYWKSLGCSLILFILSSAFTTALILFVENSGKKYDESVFLPFFIVVALSPIIISCFFLWSNIVRRFHDFNRSGKWGLVGIFFPPIGILVGIILGLIKGTDGDNDYGPKP